MIRIISSILKSASIWAILSVALRVGGGLLTLPLALRELSSAELGLYYTFIGFSGLISLLDFGFAPAVSRSAAFAMGGAKEILSSGVSHAEDSGKPNWTLLGELTAAVRLWYYAMGGMLVLLMLVPGSFFMLSMIRKAGLPLELVGCWWLFSVASAYYFVTTYWSDLLIGIGQVKSAARITVLFQLIMLLLLAAGLISGLGLWSYGVSMLVAFLVSRVITKRTSLQEAHLAFVHPVEKAKRNQILARLWPMAWRQGVVLLGAFLTLRANTLICSVKLGLDETASYGLTVVILNLLFHFAMIPITLAWPVIGRLRVERKFLEIRRVFGIRLYGGLLASIIGIAFLALWGNPMLMLMGANTKILDLPLFLSLAVILWLEVHHSQFHSLVLTENENPFVLPAVLSGLAIVTISWFVVSHWGLLGIILAQGLVQLAWNNWYPVVRGLRGSQTEN